MPGPRTGKRARYGHWLPALLLLTTCSGTTLAAGIVVIGQTGTSQAPVDRSHLRNIFRRQLRVSPQGQVLVPVNLPASHPLRQAFTRIVLKHSPESMREYWNEQYFHGISPPYVLASQEAVIRFVSQTPGAIGYILECRIDARVQVLLRVPIPPGLQDALDEHCPSPARRPSATP